MKSTRSRVLVLMVTGLLVVNANTSSAEGFFRFSLGGAFTDNTDLDFPGLVVADVEFEDSISFDMGGGGWFSILPFLDLGIQGGLSYFAPTVEVGGGFDDVDFQVLPVSVLGMVRIPLFKSERRPHGLIQPYAGIGPSFVLSLLDYDDAGADFSAVGFDVGFDLRAGVNISLTRTFGIYVEYKRTEVDSTLSDGGDDLDIEFNTDHLTVGLGISF